MKSILNDLYFGRISPWERKPDDNDKRRALNRKIESEKHYFIQKMSLDDVQRFQDFQNLLLEEDDYERLNVFASGFKLGAGLMCAVFADENEPYFDEE